MSWSEQIQTQFPAVNKHLLDYVEKAIICACRWITDAEEKELIIARMCDEMKEKIQMAHEYVQQRLPPYLTVDRMPLFLSLSIADLDYRIQIRNILHTLSEGIRTFFSAQQYHIEISQAWRQTFGMHSKQNYFRRMTDAAKDILWFMYYDCDEDSRLCGIWCGQSYLDACQTIGYDVSHLSEINLPVISWSCCQCSSLNTTLEDINLNHFIEQGAMPQGFSRYSVAEDLEELLDDESEHCTDSFTVLNLTIDPNLLKKNLSSGELCERLERSRKNRGITQYGEDGLKFLSSALRNYLKLVQTTIAQQKNDLVND